MIWFMSNWYLKIRQEEIKAVWPWLWLSNQLMTQNHCKIFWSCFYGWKYLFLCNNCILIKYFWSFVNILFSTLLYWNSLDFLLFINKIRFTWNTSRFELVILELTDFHFLPMFSRSGHQRFQGTNIVFGHFWGWK